MTIGINQIFLQRQSMKEILDLLSIQDDSLLTDVPQFWRSVATALSVEPSGANVIGNAKLVLGRLTDWDDDYVASDNQNLTPSAYEELLARINERTNHGDTTYLEGTQSRAATIQDEDEDDDEAGIEVEYRVGQQVQPPVETICAWIYRKELVLNPEWQRDFVWPLKKQRKFIESILMGLPIPSLLLFENTKAGQKYVIDGRQRLQTLATFCASTTQRDALGILGKAFKTFPSNVPGWGANQPFHAAAGKTFEKLPGGLQSKIQATPLTVFIFRDLKPRKLYQIFQRYNTGSEKLRPAEIRNAVYQARNLHKLLWRMAGESPDRSPYQGQKEQDTADLLRNVMNTRKARYGTYDFLGRVFAFTYLDNNKSVAAATNDFMDKFEAEDLEALRSAFFESFDTVMAWYRYPLVTPSDDGQFHAFLGTVQLATTHHVLYAIKNQRCSTELVKAYIDNNWSVFASEILEERQNSTNFWNRQRNWLKQLLTAGGGKGS